MNAHRESKDLFGNNSQHKNADSEPGDLLRRLAEQFRIFDTALSSIPDFAYIFDRAGRFIYANQALLDLWGLRLEDAVGRNFFDLQYPDDLAAKLQRQIQQVIETKQGLTDETPYTSPTGAGGYYEYIFRPVTASDGTVEMVAGSTRDISEHKRAEENLRRTRARLESALKAGLAGTFYWDIAADRVITDENMTRYFSLSEEAVREGVTRAEILRAIHKEDRSKVEQALTEAVESTGAYAIEYRVNHPDGKMRWLSARGLIERDEAGNAIGLPSFTVDVTERRQVEEAIRFQAHLLDTVEQAVIATDLTGTIIYWNKFAETLYGWPPAEAVGRNIIEAASLEATQEQAAEVMSLLKAARSWSGEFIVRRRDGTTFPAFITNSPINNVEGGLVGIVGISSDITERKRTENLLDAQKQSLEMVVGGAPLMEVLTFLTRVVEQQSRGQVVAAILSMDEQGRLYHAAAPSLPEEYIRAIDGMKADENVGTCCAAAARAKVVITPDIAADPKWKGFSHLPLELGFQAAWSMPILAQNGRVRGTFGTYFRERREPTALERQVLEILARTAALAIERKRAEEALREREERLRAIVEASRDGILVEEDERILYINQSYTHLLGYDSPEELIGRHVSVVISPDDAERMLEYGRSRARGELPSSVYEFKGKRKDGRLIEVEASVSTSTVAGRRYITTMVRDISGRKQAEQALRESEERFRAAFEQANVGIIQTSFDGILLMVNPGFCTILGYSEEEARGLAIRDITHPDDYEEEQELTRRLMAGESGGYSLEKRYLCKDDHIVWGQMTATIVRQESGEPFYMLTIIEDITERKRAEEELKKINEQLEGRVAERTAELMKMNASLQAEISERRRAESERATILRRLVMAQEDERRRIARDIHDHFGQQLTAMLLKLGMLKEDCGEQKELCEQIESVEAVARQLDSDVDFFVWELRPTVLDDLGLQAALTNYTQNWSQHFGIPAEVHTRGVEIENLTSEIDTVLYRIAQEALNNIAKHAQAANVTVLLEHRAETISLIVEDDGIGFDAENTSGTNDKGLGLVGMLERAALVGGTADIESQPGEGTTIYIRIPAPPLAPEGSSHE